MKLLNNSDTQWIRYYNNRLLFELYVAYLEARSGKRRTFDEHKFEANEFLNLINLRNTIINRTYRPSRGTAHVIRNPVIREIFAAAFRDRIVHHYIYDKTYEWWDKHFIYDSYSCREGKGTLFGIQRLERQMQAASDNWKHRIWVLKMDIQGYFMSLSREKLYQRAIWGLDQQFAGNHNSTYETLKFLWWQIIFDDPCRGVKKKGWPEDWADLPKTKSLFYQPLGIGIVIGNLTSQLLSNIYLDQLDHFVTETLKYKYYGRYVDDFFIIVREEDLAQARADLERIRLYLKGLGLTLHPKKTSIQPAERGVAFLGGVAYPGRIQPGKRIVKNARMAFNETVATVKDIETIISYVGHMKNYASKKLLRELFEEEMGLGAGVSEEVSEIIRAPKKEAVRDLLLGF